MTTRRNHTSLALATAMLLIGGCLTLLGRPPGTADAAAELPTSRDATQWPFAWDSIWNLPRGAAADLVPAGIQAARGMGMTIDENVLVLTPDAPQTPIAMNTAGWSTHSTRCASAQPSTVVAPNVPIPTDFSTDPGYRGSTPNMAAALLMADGTTVVQTQPFHRCGAGGTATSQWVYESADLRSGSGIEGAHGGSGMSSIGGTVRLGELVPGGAIHHALKIELDCSALCAYGGDEPDGRPGYRWPALQADGNAAGRYGGANPALQMGSLLALPNEFDEGSLRTEPARIMARALRDYGGYVVDDTGWSAYAVATEWGPQGRVTDEFAQAWGFDIESGALAGCGGGSPSCDWAEDMATLFTSLAVVDDNGPGSIGGAGARLRPCAPGFADGTGAAPPECEAGAGTARPVVEHTTTEPIPGGAGTEAITPAATPIPPTEAAPEAPS